MQRFSFFSILLCLLVASSCTQNEPVPTVKAGLTAEAVVASLPKLLDRNAAIRNGKEWDDVQNFYAARRRELRQNPGATEPRLKLAELFIQEARVTGEHPHYYPAALQMLDEVLAMIPQDNPAGLKMDQKDVLFRGLAAKASVQLSLHDFSHALETASKAVAINPYNAQIYGALVDAHVELGHYAKAVEMADKMVSIRPDLRSYSRIAYLREIHGDIQGAIDALTMAVKAGYPGQESTAWARLTLGNLYKTYGDLKNAELQYQIILVERQDYPFAIAALGEIEMQKKNYPKAEEMLKKACAIIPEVGFYEKLATLYKQTGRQTEYDALLPEITRMMQEDMEKGHNMSLELAAFHCDYLSDYDRALQYALGEYAKRPDNIDVNRLISRIYCAKKDLTKAREHYEKATVTHSKHPELSGMKKMLEG